MLGRFGLGCLLARRLAEAGARYIEVTTEYIPFLNWDTHENGHARAVAMKQQIDAPIAQLVLDLEERGLLNRTLIVLASEFSRDMLIEGKPDKTVKDQVEVPGHDRRAEALRHAPPLHRRRLRAALRRRHEERLPARATRPTSAPARRSRTAWSSRTCTPRSTARWASRPTLAYEIEQRPFYVTRDGKGKPIPELFA